MKRVSSYITDETYDALRERGESISPLIAMLLTDYVSQEPKEVNTALNSLPFPKQILYAIKMCNIDSSEIVRNRSVSYEQVSEIDAYLKSNGILTSRESICRTIEKIYGI